MRTLTWDPDTLTLRMIDQRELPGELVFLELQTLEDVLTAIRDMAVRGAPAIGITAAFGLAIAGLKSDAATSVGFVQDLEAARKALIHTRPTAVNLKWALDRLMQVVSATTDLDIPSLQELLIAEAQAMADEDVEINKRMGSLGAALLHDGDTVIHHCNTGSLATVEIGTALGVIRMAAEEGKRIHVLVNETRPRLQGSRLTAWELEQLGIPFDIITDNAAGHFLQSGAVAAVLVGADRIAANGDVVNKIGTYPLALAAKDNVIPFYCVAPISTIDLFTPTGLEIPIEERPPSEVLDIQWGDRPASPAGSTARNPAFDITPSRLITAIVTEVDVFYPPFSTRIYKAFEEATNS